MTLLETTRALEAAAALDPAVNMIVRQDILKLNTYKDARYGVFAWVQGTHRGTVDGDLVRYAFSLFYADRLTDDGSNLLDIQSAGIEVIRNILAVVADGGPVEVSEWSAHPFTQRFLDELGGVWADVTLTVPATYPCPEDYAGDALRDFNYDFNFDFYIRKWAIIQN